MKTRSAGGTAPASLLLICLAAGCGGRSAAPSGGDRLARDPAAQRLQLARAFPTGPLAAMERAVGARDAERLAARFEELTEGCNACHSREQVEYLEVRPPATRRLPIARESAAPAE
jgi:hypothetical protein